MSLKTLVFIIFLFQTITIAAESSEDQQSNSISSLISSLTNYTKRNFYKEQGLDLDKVCLSGYIKVFHNTETDVSEFFHPAPFDFKLIRCYPQSPVCISRRDTVMNPENQTQYYRFGCRGQDYWEFCKKTSIAKDAGELDKSAVFCGTNIIRQFIDARSNTPIELFKWVFDGPIRSFEQNKTNITFGVEISFLSQDNRDIIPSFDDEEHDKDEEEVKVNKAGVFSIGESMIFSKMDVISAILLIIATLKVIRVFFIGVYPTLPVDMDEHQNTISQQNNLVSTFDSKFKDEEEPYIR